jgi:hypothetical protein
LPQPGPHHSHLHTINCHIAHRVSKLNCSLPLSD